MKELESYDLEELFVSSMVNLLLFIFGLIIILEDVDLVFLVDMDFIDLLLLELFDIN